MTAPSTTPENVAMTSALRAALSSGERPRKPSAASASLTFGWRALLKIKHVPEQLLDVTMFPILFTLMFTFLFGGAIAGSTKEYLQFLLPGIVVQTVVMITMYTAVTLNTDVSKGTFDRFRSLPIWRPAVIVGALLGDLLRFTMAAMVVIVLGIILGYRPEGGPAGVILGLALVLAFSFSITWIWTCLGLVMRTPTAVMNTSMMIMFPITFMSNIFVDPETMPGWLRAIVNVNPITHLVTSVRGLMGGEVHGGDIAMTFVWCGILLAIFGPLTSYLYRRPR